MLRKQTVGGFLPRAVGRTANEVEQGDDGSGSMGLDGSIETMPVIVRLRRDCGDRRVSAV